MPLAAGSRLGPYEIVSPLGAGGMGEVYRARDPRLGREVAIKVLPDSVASDPSRLHRFEQEARAVAALSHQNIIAIFDVGTGESPYLVTELLGGETLRSAIDRGPFQLARAVETARQLVAGLEAAHARGIVHRDLKPDNIFLTRDGGLKILDFGLAKATADADISHMDMTRTGVTAAGIVIGTVGYMSPEQVRGGAADPRSDIFAVGAILYEMVSGQRAFRGSSPADTMSAVLREQPPDLTLRTGTPPAIARIVVRCLEKAAASRFQTAADLKFALDTISGAHPAAGAAPKIDRSVAVLPFANMSPDAENQYFSDGLAEELINALTRLPGLHVASRTSAFRFRGREIDIREIGRELQVTTVLEGSVRRAGPRLRVTAQLTNVADGYHLWSERYDRQMADVFDIQDEIVESIVKALAPALVGEAKAVVRRPTENLEAYELYLKGRHFWHLRGPGDLRSAIRYFERVIALDPDYALAYSGLADCLAICRAYGWFSYEQSHDRARDAVARAMALDPSLAQVNFSRAVHLFLFDRKCRDAESFLLAAVAIDPKMVDAHAYLGLVSACDGRFDEAQAHIDRAREVDPASAFVHFLAAITLCVGGRFDRAAEAARTVVELQPDSLSGLWPLGLALSGLSQHDEAIALLERAVTLTRAPFYVGHLGFAYGRAGRVDEARRLITELNERADRGEYVSPGAALSVCTGLGDVPGVAAALEACRVDRTPISTIKISCGALLEQFRVDERIDRLLTILQNPPD
jgi:eukaryotic-like serine/threonine-protein kinase